MYYLYNKSASEYTIEYTRDKTTSLFGCNSGLLIDILRSQLRPDSNEPLEWHLNVELGLERIGIKSKAIIIDLKPKQSEHNVSLYEVLDVWGYTADGWTPVLLHLKGLIVDRSAAEIDAQCFSLAGSQAPPSIYEFLYLQGTIANGKLKGKWTAPPSSPTNAALLFPKALKYFLAKIKESSPEAFWDLIST